MADDNDPRFADMAQQIDDLTALVRELSLIHAARGAQILALKAVSSLLMAQVAVRDPNPLRALGHMTAGLGGLAAALAEKTRAEDGENDMISQEITRTIELISLMAESVMPRSGS